jgi:outer membrane protein assembly factor BamB
VLQHHNHATRDGVYTDAALTKAAAATLHLDPTFSATTEGAAYGQPLFVDGGATGRDLVIVATEHDWVYGLDAASGAVVWKRSLGTPVALSDLPCGNIDPLGVTGTPIVDLASRTVFVDGMTTPDGGATKKHLVFGLSIDDGSVRAGYPVDVDAVAAVGGLHFQSRYQNQRGALALVGGTLYVPYGGHYGDCGPYHGWVLGVPLADPSAAKAWATDAQGGGVWAPGGIASDGTSLFVATGNTFGASQWSGGEAVIRLDPGPAFSGVAADYFAPTDWPALDANDVDIGGSAPILVDLPSATPSKVAIALGKNGKIYVLDRTSLGGVSVAPVEGTVASNEIIGAAAAYTTAQGTYVVFNAPGAHCPNGNGDLVALSITAGSPPTVDTAWCASAHGLGAPMVTTTDGHAEAVVWAFGAESDGKLRGYDAETGAPIFDGGGASDVMKGLKRYAPPIAAKGRIFAAGTDAVYAFKPQ